MGFSIPLDSWLRKELKTFMLKKLSKKNIEKIKLLNWDIIKIKITDHLEFRKNNEKFLWSVLVLQLWLEKYKVKINE